MDFNLRLVDIHPLTPYLDIKNYFIDDAEQRKKREGIEVCSLNNIIN